MSKRGVTSQTGRAVHFRPNKAASYTKVIDGPFLSLHACKRARDLLLLSVYYKLHYSTTRKTIAYNLSFFLPYYFLQGRRRTTLLLNSQAIHTRVGRGTSVILYFIMYKHYQLSCSSVNRGMARIEMHFYTGKK